MLDFYSPIKDPEFTLEISVLRDMPGTAFLYLQDPADDQFIDDLVNRPEMIAGTGQESNKLRFEFNCNRAYTAEDIGDAVRECVRKLKVRRGFQQPTYDARWSLLDSGMVGIAFVAYIFPLTNEIVELLNANPAVDSANVYNEGEGNVRIRLREPFSRNEVRPDLEELLRTFVGKEFVPEPEKANEES